MSKAVDAVTTAALGVNVRSWPLSAPGVPTCNLLVLALKTHRLLAPTTNIRTMYI